MLIRYARPTLGKVEQNMTPMIDVVFQLLAFFVMTFRVFAIEGDFDIKMPQAAPGTMSQGLELPLRVTLRSDESGRLTDLRFGDRSLGISYEALQREIITLVGDGTRDRSLASHIELELECDARLHYDHVVRAITAVSGYINQRGEAVRLIERIKFAPRRP
jgi:biopolymer transport protein ExbD